MWRDMGWGVRPPQRSQAEAAWPSADGPGSGSWGSRPRCCQGPGPSHAVVLDFREVPLPSHPCDNKLCPVTRKKPWENLCHLGEKEEKSHN